MNYRIWGCLKDENNEPLSNLIVKLYKIDSSIFSNNLELGNAKTDDQGKFNFEYSEKTDKSNKNKISFKIDIFVEDEKIKSLSKKNIENNFNFGDIEIKKGNIGVKGKVIDKEGYPVEGISVIVEDIDFGKIKPNVIDIFESKLKSAIKTSSPLNKPIKEIKTKAGLLFSIQDDLLGRTVTDKDGKYNITYPPHRYREIMDKNPDIKVTIMDKLGVFDISKSDIYDNVTDTIKKVEDIIISRSWIEGWFVTLNDDLPSRVSYNNDFEILIDNEDVMKKIVEVIEKAESYIYLTQYEFYPDFVPRFFPLDNSDEYKADEPLVSKLLNVNNHGIDVKIILNENTFVPDSFDEINNYFKDSEVGVRKLWAKGPYAMHAKVLVVDGKEGFIIGSPFSQSYWDTSKHIIDEKRRLDKNEGPLHDFSIYLRGNVIGYLEEFFIELWNYLSDESYDGKDKIIKKPVLNKENKSPEGLDHISAYINPLKSDNETIQITRSITPNTVSKEGEMGVLEAYRRAITNASDFIYLENQYFTNKYIINGLKQALQLNPDLQIILLINEIPDVPSYRHWQHYGFELIGLDLNKLLIEHPNVGIFAKWSGNLKNDKNELKHCYIHSKLGIVDDNWMTLGTSNLDGSSLSAAEEFGTPDSSRNYRNMEINASIFDISNPTKGNIKRIREVIWGEHLGMDLKGYSKPSKGWLDLWKDVAYNNIKMMEKEEIILNGGILPYSIEMNAERQIKDLIERYRRIKGRFNL